MLVFHKVSCENNINITFEWQNYEKMEIRDSMQRIAIILSYRLKITWQKPKVGHTSDLL